MKTVFHGLLLHFLSSNGGLVNKMTCPNSSFPSSVGLGNSIILTNKRFICQAKLFVQNSPCGGTSTDPSIFQAGTVSWKTAICGYLPPRIAKYHDSFSIFRAQRGMEISNNTMIIYYFDEKSVNCFIYTYMKFSGIMIVKWKLSANFSLAEFQFQIRTQAPPSRAVV